MSRVTAVVDQEAVVDPASIERILSRMRGRAADREGVWTDAGVGLGHALFAVTERSNREKQPSRLEDALHIVADARIDGRDALISRLERVTNIGSTKRAKDLTDDLLILHAYAAWGKRCVEHLRGDFAFAIWDARRGSLFCARDQLGVRPLYYATAGRRFLLASESECLRSELDLQADDLDDEWITDFLLFGYPQSATATPFCAIRKLPPAHSMTVDADGVRISRYWQLECPQELDFPSDRDYVERFEEVLVTAIGDRIAPGGTSVFMSGGVDSTTLAGLASKSLGNRIKAFTAAWRDNPDDQEGRLAESASAWLGIEMATGYADDYEVLDADRGGAPDLPEPSSYVSHAFQQDLTLRASEHSRVAITGWDGDALCLAWLRSHFLALLRDANFPRFGREAAWFIREQRSPPPLGVRSSLRRRRKSPPPMPAFLSPRLVDPHVEERWLHAHAPPRPVDRPVRADAMRLVQGSTMRSLLELDDRAFSDAPLCVVHPMLDLRVIDLMLSLPPVPWSVNKEIIRRIADRILPSDIARRPKAGLAYDPVKAMLKADGQRALDGRLRSAETLRFVQRELPTIRNALAQGVHWHLLWTKQLDTWLSMKFNHDHGVAHT